MGLKSKVKNKIKSRIEDTWIWRAYKSVRFSKPVKKYLKFYRKRRRDLLLFHTLPRIYNAHKNEPVDERKVIIVEHRIDKPGNSFQYLLQVLREQYDFDIHIHCIGDGFVPRKQFVQNLKNLMKDMATAKYVFICESMNFMGCFEKRPETVMMQLWHACGAFKKFGFSTAEKIFGPGMKELRRHPTNTNYNYVTVSSPEVAWAYIEALDLADRKEIVQPFGVSRTDIFFEEDEKQQAFDRVYEAFPAARGKKIILFAPTFRGRTVNAKTAEAFDPEPFYEAFKDEYVLITKHHPLVRVLPEIPAHMQGTFAYDATRTLSIEDLLCVSDICISDYSSLIFEYSLFVRPMIFFAYDLDEYFDWRGFYYPYDELTPGPVLKTNEEMVEYIRHIDERFDPQEVIAFRDKFMSACDGHATERIMNAVFGQVALEKYRKK